MESARKGEWRESGETEKDGIGECVVCVCVREIDGETRRGREDNEQQGVKREREDSREGEHERERKDTSLKRSASVCLVLGMALRPPQSRLKSEDTPIPSEARLTLSHSSYLSFCPSSWQWSTRPRRTMR